jgi:hypothetical protein
MLALFAALAGYLTLRRRNPRLVTAPGMEPAISFSEDPLTQQVVIPLESSSTRSAAPSDSIVLVPQLQALSDAPGQSQRILIGESDITLGAIRSRSPGSWSIPPSALCMPVCIALPRA